jgi:hypothetical protein
VETWDQENLIEDHGESPVVGEIGDNPSYAAQDFQVAIIM